jgi:hypothetical protein
MRAGSELAALLVALALAGTAAAANPSPQRLYQALLSARISASELPAGFARPRTVKNSPGPNPRRHHVVGEVEIDLNGGQSAIVYVVFPTRADALAAYSDGVHDLKTTKGVVAVRSPVPGLAKPSVLADASASGIGITQVTLVSGSVEIATETAAHGGKHGDEAGTVRLAKAALRHLVTVGRRIS